MGSCGCTRRNRSSSYGTVFEANFYLNSRVASTIEYFTGNAQVYRRHSRPRMVAAAHLPPGGSSLPPLSGMVGRLGRLAKPSMTFEH